MNDSFVLGILTAWSAVTAAAGRGVVREAGAAPGQAGRAAPGARHTGRPGCAAQMELRAARAAAGQDPGPVLLLAALVLAAELMPLEPARDPRGGPGGRRGGPPVGRGLDHHVPAVRLRPGARLGSPAGVVALGACSALADLLGGKAARKVLFNSAQLAIALGAAGAVYGWPAATPARPPDRPGVAGRPGLLRGQQPAGGGGVGAGRGTRPWTGSARGVGLRA